MENFNIVVLDSDPAGDRQELFSGTLGEARAKCKAISAEGVDCVRLLIEAPKPLYPGGWQFVMDYIKGEEQTKRISDGTYGH